MLGIMQDDRYGGDVRGRGEEARYPAAGCSGSGSGTRPEWAGPGPKSVTPQVNSKRDQFISASKTCLIPSDQTQLPTWFTWFRVESGVAPTEDRSTGRLGVANWDRESGNEP